MSAPTRFFAVKTTGGQEKTTATFVEARVQLKKKPIYSILVLDGLKGYIFIEADNAQVVGDVVSDFKHVKNRVPGVIQFQDLEKFLVSKPVISELSPGDMVEIIAGPFRGMRAKISRIEPTKSEVTVVLLDVSYQLPVTVDADYLKLLEKAKQG